MCPFALRRVHLACAFCTTLDTSSCSVTRAAALHGDADGFIRYITDDILKAIGTERDPDKACCLNVRHAVERLNREFREHPEVGGAVIEGAIYDIRSGEVRWLDP